MYSCIGVLVSDDIGGADLEPASHSLLSLLDDTHVLLSRPTYSCGSPLVPARRGNFLFLCTDAKDLKLIIAMHGWPRQDELLIVHAIIAAQGSPRLLM